MSFRPSSRRRAPLQLQTLEQRENPSANITTLVAGGVLTLTGTDDAEQFTVTQSGNAFTITGVNGTQIDGGTTPVTTAAATSIKMVLKGGDDIASLDSAAAFNLTGALTIDGGDGANTANIYTTSAALPVSLGSFSYLGGEGLDIVNVGQAEETSPVTVLGALSVNPGNGGSAATIVNTTVNGDLTVKAGVGQDDLTLKGVTAKKNVAVDAGFGEGSLTTRSLPFATTLKTVVTGGLSYKALSGQDSFDLADTTVNGKTGVTLAGGLGGVSLVTGGEVKVPAAGVTLTGINGGGFVFIQGTLDVFGDLKINTRTMSLMGAGAVKAANVSLATGDRLSGTAGGTWTVRKNLTLTATSLIGFINASIGTLNLDGVLTSTSTQSQTLRVGAGEVKGSASIASTRNSATFTHLAGSGALKFHKGLAVKAVIDAKVDFLSSGSVAVGGDVSVASTSTTSSFTNDAGDMTLSGGVKISGLTNASATFASPSNTPTGGGSVAKDVSLVSSQGSVSMTADAAKLTLAGKLTAKAATNASLTGTLAGVVTFQKDVTLTGTYGVQFVNFTGAGDSVFGGKLTLTGGMGGGAQFNNTGTGSTFAGDVTITGTSGQGYMSVDGGGKTFNRNVSVKGSTVQLSNGLTTTTTTFAKNLTVTSGDTTLDIIVMTGLYSVLGDATFNLGEGDSSVLLVSDTAATDFAGKLTVKTGNGDDSVEISNVQAAKDVSITSLAGRDKLVMGGPIGLPTGSVMSGAFFADLGAGDDTIDIGRTAGLTMTEATTFNGKVTIKAGAGNDTLFLGRSVTDGGDALSVVVFGAGAASSTIDGGSGVNSFDDELSQISGATNLTLVSGTFSDPN